MDNDNDLDQYFEGFDDFSDSGLFDEERQPNDEVNAMQQLTAENQAEVASASPADLVVSSYEAELDVFGRQFAAQAVNHSDAQANEADEEQAGAFLPEADSYQEIVPPQGEEQGTSGPGGEQGDDSDSGDDGRVGEADSHSSAEGKEDDSDSDNEGSDSSEIDIAQVIGYHEPGTLQDSGSALRAQNRAEELACGQIPHPQSTHTSFQGPQTNLGPGSQRPFAQLEPDEYVPGHMFPRNNSLDTGVLSYEVAGISAPGGHHVGNFGPVGGSLDISDDLQQSFDDDFGPAQSDDDKVDKPEYDNDDEEEPQPKRKKSKPIVPGHVTRKNPATHQTHKGWQTTTLSLEKKLKRHELTGRPMPPQPPDFRAFVPRTPQAVANSEGYALAHQEIVKTPLPFSGCEDGGFITKNSKGQCKGDIKVVIRNNRLNSYRRAHRPDSLPTERPQNVNVEKQEWYDAQSLEEHSRIRQYLYAEIERVLPQDVKNRVQQLRARPNPPHKRKLDTQEDSENSQPGKKTKFSGSAAPGSSASRGPRHGGRTNAQAAPQDQSLDSSPLWNSTGELYAGSMPAEIHQQWQYQFPPQRQIRRLVFANESSRELAVIQDSSLTTPEAVWAHRLLNPHSGLTAEIDLAWEWVDAPIPQAVTPQTVSPGIAASRPQTQGPNGHTTSPPIDPALFAAPFNTAQPEQRPQGAVQQQTTAQPNGGYAVNLIGDDGFPAAQQPETGHSNVPSGDSGYGMGPSSGQSRQNTAPDFPRGIPSNGIYIEETVEEGEDGNALYADGVVGGMNGYPVIENGANNGGVNGQNGLGGISQQSSENIGIYPPGSREWLAQREFARLGVPSGVGGIYQRPGYVPRPYIWQSNGDASVGLPSSPEMPEVQQGTRGTKRGREDDESERDDLDYQPEHANKKRRNE